MFVQKAIVFLMVFIACVTPRISPLIRAMVLNTVVLTSFR
jgi:hypothetical protein